MSWIFYDSRGFEVFWAIGTEKLFQVYKIDPVF